MHKNRATRRKFETDIGTRCTDIYKNIAVIQNKQKKYTKREISKFGTYSLERDIYLYRNEFFSSNITEH